jgi:hypothetical protein
MNKEYTNDDKGFNNYIVDKVIPVELEAKRLFEENGEKAIDIVNRRIASFNNQHSKESDFWYSVLTEVEKLIDEKNV